MTRERFQELLESCTSHAVAVARATIPALKLFGKMEPGGDSKFDRDEYGNYGWALKRIFSAADGRQAKLQFTVTREDGQLAVAYFGLWR